VALAVVMVVEGAVEVPVVIEQVLAQVVAVHLLNLN
jgi:hypothetical protein